MNNQDLDVAAEIRNLKRKLDRQNDEINFLRKKHYKSRSRSSSRSNRSNSIVSSRHRSHHRSHRSDRNRDKCANRNQLYSKSALRARSRSSIDTNSTPSSPLSGNSNNAKISSPVAMPASSDPPIVNPTVDLPDNPPSTPSVFLKSKESVPSNDTVVKPTVYTQSGALTNTNPLTDKVVVNIEETSEQALGADVLEAMGKRLDAGNQYAPDLHNDIILRWEDIIKGGLPEDEKKNLWKKHLTPENCLIFEPPKLNAEIKASVLEPIITRDNKIAEKQKKVSVCLSTLGSMLSHLLRGITLDSLTLISNLSDMGRMLVDLQRDETLTRRLIISSNLNAGMKETLNGTTADEWLFGKDLSETLKTAKSLERSSKDLKPFTKSSINVTPRTPKNLKGPRRHPYKQQLSTSGQCKTYSQPPKTSSFRQPSKKQGGSISSKKHR